MSFDSPPPSAVVLELRQGKPGSTTSVSSIHSRGHVDALREYAIE